ncbi:MAG: hypothetical protein ABFR35_02150 [Thermodesulfobacteriota bacterium]
MSYGVLEALAKVEIPSENPQTKHDNSNHTLLDEVDFISSVSGGSFTAAYYGLHGKKAFENYKERFLYQNVQSAPPRFWKGGVVMATVVIQKRPRENGNSYVITYKDPNSGRKRYYKTFRKANEARQAANDLRYLLDNGKVASIQKNYRKSKLLTVDEACKNLKRDWRDKAQNKALSPVTVEGYLGRLGQIASVFGKRFLCEITEKEILAYRNAIAKSTSNANANRILFVVKQIFSCGEELGAITENPLSGIKMLSEKAHERNCFLLPDSLMKLLEACQQVRSRFYLVAIIFLGAEHGASKQEILSLKWTDLDFNHEGKGLIHFFRTKNKRESMNPLPKSVKHWWEGTQGNT